MPRIFILGPGHWHDPRPGLDPLGIRRLLASVVSGDGVQAFTMEDREPAQPDDAAAKFLRLLEESTHVWVLWPAGARMPTTAGEMTHIRFLLADGTAKPVTVFYQDGTVDVRAGKLWCIDEEARNAYLQDLFMQPGVRAQPWSTLDDLLWTVKVFCDHQLW